MIALGFNVAALPDAEFERLRGASHDDYGNALVALDESGPCRHCLRYARPGERVLLASYSPFERANAYREVGPVYIHAEACERYAGAGLPPDFRTRPLALRAYDREQTIVHGEPVAAGAAGERIDALLADPRVAYVHARSLSHGCYLFRIERTERGTAG